MFIYYTPIVLVRKYLQGPLEFMQQTRPGSWGVLQNVSGRIRNLNFTSNASGITNRKNNSQFGGFESGLNYLEKEITRLEIKPYDPKSEIWE